MVESSIATMIEIDSSNSKLKVEQLIITLKENIPELECPLLVLANFASPVICGQNYSKLLAMVPPDLKITRPIEVQPILGIYNELEIWVQPACEKPASWMEKIESVSMLFSDSIIFHSTPDDAYFPPTGDHLGNLTNELSEYGQNCYISEFVSAGPKHYSFTVRDPKSGRIVKTVTKVKGFSLNYSTSAHINFKRMRKQVKNFVLHKQTDEVALYNPQIKRMKDHQIVTELTRKV